MKTKSLTGITTTGTPHMGNFTGAIAPAIAESSNAEVESYYFLADYHSLVKCRDPDHIAESTKKVAATWIACGLDTSKVIFYRQSDVPEILELCWVLTNLTSKGLMNRAHAYKGVVQENLASNQSDPDAKINMGLFCYPILMAADVLLFNANNVPVGKDQIQHIEMIRDIALRFNHYYGDIFTLPQATLREYSQILKGLDGRKMSKSYNNTIPIFASSKELLKLIKKIKTNSLEPGEPKDPDTCTLFGIWASFASAEEIAIKRKEYEDGAGWGQLKLDVFNLLDERLSEPRTHYNELIKDVSLLETSLKEGALKAREKAQKVIDEVRYAIGIRPLL